MLKVQASSSKFTNSSKLLEHKMQGDGVGSMTVNTGEREQQAVYIQGKAKTSRVHFYGLLNRGDA